MAYKQKRKKKGRIESYAQGFAKGFSFNLKKK